MYSTYFVIDGLIFDFAWYILRNIYSIKEETKYIDTFSSKINATQFVSLHWLSTRFITYTSSFIHVIHFCSKEIFVPRMFPACLLPISPECPLNSLYDYSKDIPMSRPEDALTSHPRDIPISCPSDILNQPSRMYSKFGIFEPSINIHSIRRLDLSFWQSSIELYI